MNADRRSFLKMCGLFVAGTTVIGASYIRVTRKAVKK